MCKYRCIKKISNNWQISKLYNCFILPCNAAKLYSNPSVIFFLSPTQGLFLINNKISKIHPKAFRNMDNLRLLYLSYNQLKEIPANLPPNVIELRFHENNINKIQRDAFFGLRKLNVLGETCFYLFTFFWVCVSML